MKNKLFLILFTLAVFNGLGTNHCVASEYRIGITTSEVFDIFSRSPGIRRELDPQLIEEKAKDWIREKTHFQNSPGFDYDEFMKKVNDYIISVSFGLDAEDGQSWRDLMDEELEDNDPDGVRAMEDELNASDTGDNDPSSDDA